MNRLYRYIEQKSTHRYYELGLTVALMLVSWIMAYPDLLFNGINSNDILWQALEIKRNDLTSNLDQYPPESHMSKKVFRLTVPLIMKALELSKTQLIILQYILGFLIPLFSFRLSRRILDDGVSATFVAAGIAFTYFGFSSFVAGAYDVFSYFSILLAMYSTRFIPILFFCSMAAWNDERGFFALLIALAYHATANRKNPHLDAYDRGFKLNASSYAVLASIALYVFVRVCLTRYYGMRTPLNKTMEPSIWLESIKYLQLSLITYFEGFWIIVMIVFFRLFKGRDHLKFIVYAGTILPILAISVSVLDMTRSGSYLIPFVFVCLNELLALYEKKTRRNLLFIASIFSFAFPPVQIILTHPRAWFLESFFSHFINWYY